MFVLIWITFINSSLLTESLAYFGTMINLWLRLVRNGHGYYWFHTGHDDSLPCENPVFCRPILLLCGSLCWVTWLPPHQSWIIQERSVCCAGKDGNATSFVGSLLRNLSMIMWTCARKMKHFSVPIYGKQNKQFHHNLPWIWMSLKGGNCIILFVFFSRRAKNQTTFAYSTYSV